LNKTAVLMKKDMKEVNNMESSDKKKLEELKREIMKIRVGEDSDSYLIAVLHRAQELFGYLPQHVMDEIALAMDIPTAHIWGVATFYHYFNLTPPGKHVISVCLGTACYIKGAGQILNVIKKHLGIDMGDVTEDGLFSLQGARCLGACGQAPVVMIDDKIYGELNPEKIIKVLRSILREEKKKSSQKEVSV